MKIQEYSKLKSKLVARGEVVIDDGVSIPGSPAVRRVAYVSRGAIMIRNLGGNYGRIGYRADSVDLARLAELI